MSSELGDDELRAVASEFERRRARVVLAIIPVALLTVVGVLFWRDSPVFLLAFPLSLFALGAYVHRIFRCPNCGSPVRSRAAVRGRCGTCGVPLESSPET